MKVAVEDNRSARKWSLGVLAARILRATVNPFFRFSPRQLWGWRRFMLRAFGARIGKNVHIYPSVNIAIPWNLDIGDLTAIGDRVILYSLGLITIGQRATVSQGAHICAGSHDYSKPDRPLTKTPITIGNDAWICADAFLGPDVSVGSDAIVGARAVVVKDVADAVMVGGNPARKIKDL